MAESSPFLNTGQTGSPTSTSSSPITPPSLSSSPSRFFPSPSSSRFRVTLVEPSSAPTVTSPSGNVTVGFNFKQNDTDSTKQENSSAPAPDAQVEKTSAPEIVVTSLASSSIQQAPTSQTVKVTVKLDPETDNLIIENETCSSITSDVSEADLEVRSILDQGRGEEENSWVNSSVQDSVTLLRRAGRGLLASPEEETPPQVSSCSLPEMFMLVQNNDVDKNLSTGNFSRTSDVTQDSVISKLVSVGYDIVTESKLELKEGDHISDSIKKPETVQNNIVLAPTLMSVPDNMPVPPAQQISQVAPCDSDDITRKPETVENNIKQPSAAASAPVPPSQRTRKISWIAPCDSDDITRQLEVVENNVKQPSPSPTPVSAAASCPSPAPSPVPPAQRNRKISWIAPSDPEEPKSSLERLLGLFHHPGSFFSKTHQQYKAAPAAVNQRPVANSNASFLLTTGPLAGIANGGSVLSSSHQGRDSAEKEQHKETSHDTVPEVKLSPKQSPGVLRKEKQTSNCENPIPDVLNNNNKVEDITELATGVLASSEQLSEDGNKCISRQCEDENYNLPRSLENVIDTKVSDDNGTKTSSQIAQAVSVRSSNPSGDEEGSKETCENYCDSKCNVSSSQEDVMSEKARCDGADKSWSRSCESSYVQGSAATVRLVGGASGFEFPPIDSDKDEASGLLLPDLSGMYITNISIFTSVILGSFY